MAAARSHDEQFGRVITDLQRHKAGIERYFQGGLCTTPTRGGYLAQPYEPGANPFVVSGRSVQP